VREALNRSRLTSLVSALALIAAGLLLAAPAQGAVDYDCGDFSNQAQAQKYLLPGDPYRLDADDDGIACDSLPCPCSSAQPHQQPGTAPHQGHQTLRQGARIVRVVDGDTVVVKLDHGRQRYVRLLGIDAPEVSGGTECYGPAATRRLRVILPVRTHVQLVSDPSQARVDRYGRLLRYIQKQKVDVDRRLVALGAAKVYVYGGKPFKRVTSYRAAQSSAKQAHRGLWGACS
jgi:endonuclease YncB( thermonuclease family)